MITGVLMQLWSGPRHSATRCWREDHRMGVLPTFLGGGGDLFVTSCLLSSSRERRYRQASRARDPQTTTHGLIRRQAPSRSAAAGPGGRGGVAKT